jgi:gluconate 2-dehydrogenase alpha chain
MARLPKTDVVIVGVGWAGGILANEIVQRTNLNVVGLERGPYNQQNLDFIHDHDELRYAVRLELMQDLSRETITFRNDNQQTALPMRQLGSFLPGEGVGGAGVHWNGQTWRFKNFDLTMRTQLEQNYKDLIPQDMTVQDWGVTYNDLEPYYDKFEYLAGVSGLAGNVKGQLQEGGNVFEDARSRPYPLPPLNLAYSSAIFLETGRNIGLHTFPGPAANLSQAYTNPNGNSLAGCGQCGYCERFGCDMGAKASALITVIPTALATGRFDLRPNSRVLRINKDNSGRPISVTYLDPSGVEQEQPADLILLTAWTLNNNLLLMLSQIGQMYDPATGQGVLGRNASYQLGGAGATGFFDDRILNRFMGSGANQAAAMDYQMGVIDFHRMGAIGGGSLSCGTTGARPIQQGAVPSGTPSWGSAWKAAYARYFNRWTSAGFQMASPAYRQNHFDLDPTYKDAYGRPLLRWTFDWTDNERKAVAYLQPFAENAVRAMGVNKVNAGSPLGTYTIIPYQSTHVNGGTIMGTDPKTSVVNRFLQHWDAPNLFVVGASNFPQNAGYNPTGTVGALAYWAADAIINRYLKSPRPLVAS